MAANKRRSEWNLDKKGRWIRAFGERGMRIRLFQKRKDGNFYRAIWRPDKGADRQCLYTKDRAEADRIGKTLLIALLQDEPQKVDSPVLLKSLFDRYCKESADYLDNKPHTKLEAEGRMNAVMGFFGPDRDVRLLTATDCSLYARRRFDGGVVCLDGRVTESVRARTVQADLKLLSAVLKWAMSVPVGNNGGRLLSVHPLLGVKFPRERNPKRPMASWERFQSTRQALQALADEAETNAKRELWGAADVALAVLEATGRRRGSVVQLMWEDIDFEKNIIHWRADADKMGIDWIVEMPLGLPEELRQYRSKVGGLAGYLFPSPTDSSKAMSGDLLSSLIERGERKANLPKLDGGLLHPYRRKWVTERKDHPDQDVAAVGGWKSVQTLVMCYQRPDRESMLAVINEPRKVVEKTVIGR